MTTVSLVSIGRQACESAEAAMLRLSLALAERPVSSYGIVDSRRCESFRCARRIWCLSSDGSGAGDPQHIPFSRYCQRFASQLGKLRSELRQIISTHHLSNSTGNAEAVSKLVLVLSLDESFSLNVGRHLLRERDFLIGLELVLLQSRWRHEVPPQALYPFLQEMEALQEEFREVVILDARPIESDDEGDCIQRRDYIGDVLTARLLDLRPPSGGVVWPLEVAWLPALPSLETRQS